MPFDPNKFINPGQFGDYSSYSGMGGDQQMKSVKQVAAEFLGVPAAGGATPDQVSAPVQQKFTNISNAATQFGQGNFAQGVNAYRGYQPQPSVINQHYGVDQ